MKKKELDEKNNYYSKAPQPETEADLPIGQGRAATLPNHDSKPLVPPIFSHRMEDQAPLLCVLRCAVITGRRRQYFFTTPMDGSG